MKKFQELLTKDLGWKLLSIAIAATMWFMVINITQPVDTRSYSRPLTLENMDTLTSRGLTVGNAEELKNKNYRKGEGTANRTGQTEPEPRLDYRLGGFIRAGLCSERGFRCAARQCFH